jgi:hypothetical protein
MINYNYNDVGPVWEWLKSIAVKAKRAAVVAWGWLRYVAWHKWQARMEIRLYDEAGRRIHRNPK